MSKRKTKETKVKAAPAKKRKRAKAAKPVGITAAAAASAPAERETRNGVRRPAPGGLCATVWDQLDKLYAGSILPTSAQVRDLAVASHLNVNNALTELSQWRRWMGLSKPRAGKRGARGKAAAKAAPPAQRIDGSVDQYLA